MKVGDVIFRAIARKITWWQAAEALGVPELSVWRHLHRYAQVGYEPRIWSRREMRPKCKFVPLGTPERILWPHERRYSRLDVRAFHAKLRDRHQIEVTQRWLELALGASGLRESEPSVDGSGSPSPNQSLDRRQQTESDRGGKNHG